MAYYKVLIEVWCDWDPRKSDLKEIAGHVALREGAICTLQEVIRMVDRPQEIENDAAMSFFGGEEGDADESQGWPDIQKAPDRVASGAWLVFGLKVCA